jgi:hypothetical protein
VGERGPACKLCQAPNAGVIAAAIRAGAGYAEVMALAKVKGVNPTQQAITSHRTHVGKMIEVTEDLKLAIKKAIAAMTEEMETQPPVMRAQYAIAIATIGDVLHPARPPDPKAAVAALKNIQDRQGGGGNDNIKLFMQGVMAAAEAITSRTRELPEPATTEVTVGEVEAQAP